LWWGNCLGKERLTEIETVYVGQAKKKEGEKKKKGGAGQPNSKPKG